MSFYDVLCQVENATDIVMFKSDGIGIESF